MTPLTDQELLQLVQEKEPGELTEAEIDQLRKRLRDSAELRNTLLEQLHLDTYLSAAFGRFEISVDQILASASTTPVNRLRTWGWMTGLVLLLALGITGLFVWNRPAQPPEVAVAQADDKTVEAGKQEQPQLPATEVADTAQEKTAAEVAMAETESPAVDPIEATKPEAEAVATPPTENVVNVWKKVYEAEAFAEGNVRVDVRNMGAEIGVIYADDAEPAFVEYDVAVPQGGKYQFDLRYAAKLQRPLRLLVNGQLVMSGICQSTTRDWRPQFQEWFAVGEIELQAGLNQLRLEADPPLKQRRLGQFPAIDKFRLASTFSITAPLPADESESPDVPWATLSDAKSPALPVEQGAFARHEEQWGLRRTQLQEWLSPVPNEGHQFHEAQHNEVPVAGFEGLLKLKAPWTADAVLRLSAFDHAGLRLHFWSGSSGITLQFSDRPSPWWGAYATQRQPNSPRPKEFVLIGSDDGRYDRSLPGPFEVRHQAGTLILSRGNVRLLTVPCPAAPEEVYFDGRGWFRGLTMYRGQPLPEEPDVVRPVVLRTTKPASWNHMPLLPTGATLTPQDDGSLKLAGEKLTAPARATFALEQSGLYELVFLVEDASPGTGIFLNDLQGQPVHRVGFFKEHNTQARCLAYLRPNENHDEAWYDHRYQIVPFTGQQTWLRLILGQGSLKCWTSGDGRHWGRALEPMRQIRGGSLEFGIYCLPGPAKRSIVLKQIEVRELHGLTDLVPDDLLARAPHLPGDLTVETWFRHVVETQPAEWDPQLWRQACALKTLSQGPPAELGRALLSGLAADAVARPVSPADRLRFLADYALWDDTWDQADAQRLAASYEELGMHLAAEGHPQVCEIVATGLISAPLWATLPVRITPDRLVLQDLTDLLYREQWPQVAELTRWLRFWNRASHPATPEFQHRDSLRQFVDLAAIRAQRALGEPVAAQPNRGPEPTSTRHPLIEQLSKEGYNILAELDAALTGEAYRDACQIIMSASTQGAQGLLPDLKDPRLLVSLTGAVRLAMQAHPQLLETLNDQFAAVGRLRVRQAIAEGQVPAVQAATVQFLGTEAAAEAHAWLGDRSLAAGQFAQAAGQYQEALQGAPIGLQGQIRAKIQLVQALTGQLKAAPEAPTQPVTLAGENVSPENFVALLNSLQQARSTGSSAAPVTAAAAIPPSGWALGRRFPFDGEAGQHPGTQRIVGADLVGREFHLSLFDNWLLMSNRVQVAAYDLTDGQLKWRTSLGNEQGDSRSWSSTPFVPAVAGNQVFVRRLTQHGIDLAAIELKSGTVQWTKRPGSHILSDPLLVQDNLFVLGLEEPQFGVVHVSLLNLSPETGEILSQTLLVQLRDAWGTKVPCSAVVAGDQILATVGGCVICCDTLGQIRWLRRQPWLPPQDEFGFQRQHRQPPVVLGNRVWVTQPGVWAVECLDRGTGRQVWQRAWPGLRRIIGVNGGRVIVETETDWVACQAETGHTDWTRQRGDLLEGLSCPANGPIVVAESQTLDKNKRRVGLLWIDPATGGELGRWTIPELQEESPQVGQLLARGDRLWLAWGKNQHEFRREIVELVPMGTAHPGVNWDVALQHWSRHVSEEVRTVANGLFPGWMFVTPLAPGQVAYHPSIVNEQDVLSTANPRERSMVWLRRVSIPEGGSAKLRLTAGLEQRSAGQFTVKINDQTAGLYRIDAQQEERWVRQEIDLSAHAGKTVWLHVSLDPLGDGQVSALWKRLDLVP